MAPRRPDAIQLLGDVCHFDLTRATNLGADLAEALGQIRQVITSCSFSIPPNPDGALDPTLVNLVMTSDEGVIRAVPRDLSSANGWNHSADMTEVVMLGDYCEQAIKDRRHLVRMSYLNLIDL